MAGPGWPDPWGRRSIAMLPPRAPAMNREEAMKLLAELQEAERWLGALRDGLGALLTDEGLTGGEGGGQTWAA